MTVVYKEIEIDLDDFTTQDLIEELESRREIRYTSAIVKELVHSIWAKRRLNQDFSQEVDSLIYQVEGKIL